MLPKIKHTSIRKSHDRLFPACHSRRTMTDISSYLDISYWNSPFSFWFYSKKIAWSTGSTGINMVSSFAVVVCLQFPVIYFFSWSLFVFILFIKNKGAFEVLVFFLLTVSSYGERRDWWLMLMLEKSQMWRPILRDVALLISLCECRNVNII